VSTRAQGARIENSEASLQMHEYIDSVGGDVYLKSRPGETAEFTAYLPLRSSAQASRLKLKNQIGTGNIA
jgi:hypothetical protein